MNKSDNSNAYGSFASVYDCFMDNIPYEEWADYIESLLKEYRVQEGLILDMGCGTGSVTRELHKRGYEMIGIDNSADMLSVAAEKQTDPPILYLLQDMRELELYGTVKAVVSICDSINYIIEPEDLIQVFHRVNTYLDEGGIFIFDFNTEYKYREILGESTIAENRDNASFIWDNYYDEEEQINEYNLTLYVKVWEGTEQGNSYLRYDELHYQKAYSIETIKHLLLEGGMEYIAAYDAFTREEPRHDSERIYVIAREKVQKGKYYQNANGRKEQDE